MTRPMTRTGKTALLASAVLLGAGAASAQIVDDYGVVQPETGVTGVGINDAAPSETVQEGGYVPPAEAEARRRAGTLPGEPMDLSPGAEAHTQTDIQAETTFEAETAGTEFETETGLSAEAEMETEADAPEYSSAMLLNDIQLNDADLVNTAGVEIGEVDSVVHDPSGKAVSVMVELEDEMFGEDILVEMDLAELDIREDANYRGPEPVRYELVTDLPTAWFREAHNWRAEPNPETERASR
mgnify:CR=1 FL=1